jgi:hypothetical protein
VISVYRNTSRPGTINSNSFAPRVDIQTGGWADWVALGDLSGNGKLDIAVAEQSPNQMELFQNLSAAGTFTSSSLAAPVVFGAGWDANSVLIGDFDGDGRPDIFMANGYSLNVSVYQNLDPFSGPPVFTEQPVSQTVLAGSAVTLTAFARGATPLQYQWYFYHHSLSGATASSLSLGPVRAANAGDYSVTVKNRYGSITSTNAVVTVVRASDVSDAVVLPPGPSVQVVAEGKNVTLTWPVGASEVLTATNLAGPWQPLNVSLATNGFNISASVPATNQQQFFRLSGQ